MVFENITNTITTDQLLKFALLILISLVLGIFVKSVILQIGSKIIYPWVRKSSPSSYKRTKSGIELTSSILQWVVILLFMLQALSIFKIYLLDEIIRLTIIFIPRLGVSFLILVIGLIITSIITRKISNLDFKGSDLISKFLEIILIFAIILSALEAVGIRVTAFQDIFRASIYGIMFAGALVIGIAFGLALKPEVEKWILNLKKKKN